MPAPGRSALCTRHMMRHSGDQVGSGRRDRPTRGQGPAHCCRSPAAPSGLPRLRCP
ncbi:hypothetical protein ATKI12_2120 [Kitasatospora sp. Ki12]